MSIDQIDKIDVVNIDTNSGDVWLTISDHLSWDQEEGEHLLLLQNKLNAYLRFIESGEVFVKFPEARGRKVVINLVGKFLLSDQANLFFTKARTTVNDAGSSLQFKLMPSN